MDYAVIELARHFFVALLFGALNGRLPGRAYIVEVGLAERVEYGFNESWISTLITDSAHAIYVLARDACWGYSRNMKFLLFLIIASCSLIGQAPKLQNPEPLSADGPMKISSIRQLQELQNKVCAAHYVASYKIYLKGEAASDKEKADFLLAAKELVRLQDFIERNRYSFKVAVDSRDRTNYEGRLADHLANLSVYKIKADLPATKAELNEGGKFANLLSGGLMTLPLYFSPFGGGADY